LCEWEGKKGGELEDTASLPHDLFISLLEGVLHLKRGKGREGETRSSFYYNYEWGRKGKKGEGGGGNVVVAIIFPVDLST